MSDWYYSANNQPVGPLRPEAIRDLLSRGAISPETLVWTAAFGASWRPVRETEIMAGAVAPPPTAHPQSGAPHPPQGAPDSPAVWNPNASAAWSLLFTPAFGAFLHAKNAELLGRTAEADANRIWFYCSLAYLVVVAASVFFPMIPDRVFNAVAIGLLAGWYFSLGRKQAQYVRGTWQGRYQRKPWTIPLLVAFGCLIAYSCIIVALIFVVEE